MTTQTDAAISPKPILELGTAFFAARALQAAVELELFTVLSDGPATEPEVRERLGLHERGSRDFLDALVAIGLLTREDGRYGNAPLAAQYLDQGRDSYLGGWMAMASHMLYPVWSRLSDGLRTGQPQAQGLGDDGSFPRIHQDAAFFADFTSAMDAYTGMIGPELARVFDWSQYKEFTDVGGARGNLAAILTRSHPHLGGAVFDLPNLQPLFTEHMASLGLAGKIQFHPGNFFTDALPSTQVIVFGHVLHDWDVNERRQLVQKAFEALPAGGTLLIYDRMMDDDRQDRALSLFGSLNLLLVTPGGSEYTLADCRVWLAGAGFSEVTATPILGDTETLVAARKAG
jgi:hypothetical protein